MTNPTSNFGWQMPTSTDLVTDLPADFEVFGQAVDTTMADLKGGTTGQILSKATNTNMDFVWIDAAPGDITGVTVSSPITGGGVSGSVNIAIQDASTTQKGAVQLSDSTSTTSSILASTPTAVKSAYDLAAAAIPKTLTTTTGDTIYASSANTPARLAVGTTGQVLTVAGGVPTWATPSSPTQTFTLVASTAMSGSASISTNVSGYNRYFINVDQAQSSSSSTPIFVRFNSNSSGVYASTYLLNNTFSGYYAGGINRSATSIDMGGTNQSGNFSNFNMSVVGASGSGIKTWDATSGDNSNGFWYARKGYFNSNTAITSIQVLSLAGNYTGGYVTIWGAN